MSIKSDTFVNKYLGGNDLVMLVNGYLYNDEQANVSLVTTLLEKYLPKELVNIVNSCIYYGDFYLITKHFSFGPYTEIFICKTLDEVRNFLKYGYLTLRTIYNDPEVNNWNHPDEEYFTNVSLYTIKDNKRIEDYECIIQNYDTRAKDAFKKINECFPRVWPDKELTLPYCIKDFYTDMCARGGSISYCNGACRSLVMETSLVTGGNSIEGIEIGNCCGACHQDYRCRECFGKQ